MKSHFEKFFQDCQILFLTYWLLKKADKSISYYEKQSQTSSNKVSLPYT